MSSVTEDPQPRHSLRLESIRVLLVQSNAGDERLLRLALSEDPEREFQVATAETLGAAIQLVQAMAFDAILLDIHSADSRGLASLKELALAAPRIPILVTSGLDDDSLAIQVSLHGAQDYLVKGTHGQADLSRAIRCAIARKRFEAALAQRAYFDPLTGLANRGLFNDRLTHALARARREDKRVALMFIDLDHFKAVNDSLGHKVGDEVLRSVAEALCRVVRETDTVARLGGDEFTVLLEPLEDLGHVDRVAQKLLGAVQIPVVVSGAPVQVTASMGIAIYPEHARRAETLLQSADATMFFAKRCGGNRFRLTRQRERL